MNNEKFVSEEQLDFLREMMNVGAGNAVTALSQMLQREVNMDIPAVRILPAPQVSPILDNPSLPVTCVRMGMVGDATGDLFFIVPDEHKASLIHLVQQATPGPKDTGTAGGHSIITEIGNIVAGVYMRAIHDFCKLNIYHTLPALKIDMLQSLLDGSIAAMSHQAQIAFIIENVFVVEEHRIRTFFLILPPASSVQRLVDSMGQAKMALA